MGAGAVRGYEDLLIWQKGIALTKLIYSITDDFPKREEYGLAAQMRRAAVSVPSNIAEGQARQHSAEFRHYLYIALGSLAELDTQARIGRELGFLDQGAAEVAARRIAELRKMVGALARKLSAVE